MSLHFVGYVARGNVKKIIGKKKEEYVALSKLELMLELSHKGQLGSIALWALVRDSLLSNKDFGVSAQAKLLSCCYSSSSI